MFELIMLALLAYIAFGILWISRQIRRLHEDLAEKASGDIESFPRSIF